MKKKGLSTLFGIICLMLILAALLFMAACAAPAPAPAPTPAPTPTPTPLPPAEPLVLKAITSFSPFAQMTQALYLYQERVNERANGEVVIQFLGGPEVIAIPDQAMAAKKGVVDLVFCFTAYTGLVPAVNSFALSTLPFEEERERGFEDFMREEHKKAGLFFIGRGWGNAPVGKQQSIWLKNPIERPQDLAGMKIGEMSHLSYAFISALGASPALIAIPDAYAAAERGVVDGLSGGPSLMIALGLPEVLKYKIEHRYYTDDIVFIIGLEQWDRLPGHLQKLLIDVHLEVEPEWLATIPAYEEQFSQTLLDAGVTLIKFSQADAEYFGNLAYEALWEDQVAKYPDIMPAIKEMLAK